MTETRIVEGGTFGPVFSNGVSPEVGVSVVEGIVHFHLVRFDAILTIELTVKAAAHLVGLLADSVAKELQEPH